MHVNVETQMLLVSERTMSPTGLSVCLFVCLSGTLRSNILETKGAMG